jgi:catechol 2,3-dioxygenase-like lactoylglutathione lyase family enzyme
MPRGLDHIVHAVRDLDAAAEFYRRAGVTVGARNRHATAGIGDFKPFNFEREARRPDGSPCRRMRRTVQP